MMARNLMAKVFPGVLLAATACCLVCRAGPAPTSAEEAKKAYEERLIDLLSDHLEGLIAAREAYIESLESVRRQSVADGKIEEALEISKRIKEVESQLEQDRARLSFLLPRAVIQVTGTGFQMKILRDGATAFSNRDYVWRNVPDELEGWRYTQIAGGDTPAIRVTVQKPGVVFAATASAGHLLKAGWHQIGSLVLRYSNSGATPLVILAGHVEAGTSLEVQHQGWTGTIVLIPDEAGRKHIHAFLKRYLTSLQVPIDAVEFGRHWYKHYRVPMTWHGARRRCEQLGGYLACVTSRQEHVFLSRMLAGRVAWIGGSDEEQEGHWVWVSGEPFRFTAWLPGEPNNTSSREDGLCYGYQDGGRLVGWNDWNLQGRTGFICEWSPKGN